MCLNLLINISTKGSGVCSYVDQTRPDILATTSGETGYLVNMGVFIGNIKFA